MHEHDPEISVLVPIFNVERYLRECLDSILAQSFSDYEVICINDGSTDSSRDIIQEYLERDPRFRVIDKPNSGYGASMNEGLAAARGNYIAILESDDRFLPDALNSLHAAAVEYDAQVVKGDFDLYWSIPEPRSERFDVLAGCTLRTPLKPVDEPRIFSAKSSIWSCLYDAQFLKENDIRFLGTPGASYQDTAFNFKALAAAERAVFIDDVILEYRQDNESSSVNSAAKAYCVCDEYAEIDRWIAEKDSSLDPSIKGIEQRVKYDNYLWNYDRLPAESKLAFLERFADEFEQAQAEGVLDLALFEPWAEADLLAIMKSPQHFQRCRDAVSAPGKLNTFRHYYRIGGLPLIFKVLKYKREH